ncbi:MAG TPA: DUF2156 domain-containing protein [Planctomycetaceae bacterium]|nr:DUF2156 domain-containing protein [Planctomycetaceae bacterium]
MTTAAAHIGLLAGAVTEVLPTETHVVAPPAVGEKPLSAAEPLEELAFRYGRTYDSSLAVDADRTCFWSHDGSGVVSFLRSGRSLQVGGGLLAASDAKPRLLAEFTDFIRTRGWQATFYNIPDDDLPLFRERGYQVTKWGEEALIDLPGLSCRGKAFEWVRRQTNYCRRKGLVFFECRQDEMSLSEWCRLTDEMRAVGADLLAAKPQRSEMRFMEGQFEPDRLGQRRLFCARADGGAGRVEGFLVCNPGEDGDFWALELYRQRHDAVRGTIAFLTHQALELFQREGAKTASLCLIPSLGCEQPQPGESALARRALVWGARYFPFIFNVAGLYHFKSRFRPRFESRSICASPRITLRSAWAFVRVLGVLNLDWGKLLRLSVGRRPGK